MSTTTIPQIKPVNDAREIAGILQLQQQNLRSNISEEEKSSQGFLSISHDTATLQSMVNKVPQFVAVAGYQVAGYVLSMTPAMTHEVPTLTPMFDTFDKAIAGGRPIASYNYVACGQACVGKDFRGQGLLTALYEKMREDLSARFELCVTAIAVDNGRSMRAHGKVGFRPLCNYWDHGVEWTIVAWDWNNLYTK
ncbi:MAG: hypothetical protein P0Y53_17715 [Candidatus Pseudobacter hemicellulosilyticus]|uniref:Uncharacterized protein n=1 Tax=Candidatus Pseudobacter hemicellulosilyticus TaxID=3121375 RepID=A0AAJ6BFI9_9BACT|nr:MAG: hypothetical protein P0Y53_17715 [Pseudobacter sp.]